MANINTESNFGAIQPDSIHVILEIQFHLCHQFGYTTTSFQNKLYYFLMHINCINHHNE